MDDLRKLTPALVALAGTGLLGAGVLMGTVSVTVFLTFITAVILPSPLFKGGPPDDPPPQDVP